MLTIATFDVPENAHLFRAYLESRGIEAAVLDEHFVQLFWYYSQAIGGVRVVLYHDEDWDAAMEARSEYFTALSEAPSLLTEVRGWPLVLVLSWFVGGPLLLFGRRQVRQQPRQEC